MDIRKLARIFQVTTGTKFLQYKRARVVLDKKGTNESGIRKRRSETGAEPMTKKPRLRSLSESVN